jgi:hypothetical protein
MGRAAPPRPTSATSILIYHRIGGRTPDERDVTLADFRRRAAVRDPSQSTYPDDVHLRRM